MKLTLVLLLVTVGYVCVTAAGNSNGKDTKGTKPPVPAASKAKEGGKSGGKSGKGQVAGGKKPPVASRGQKAKGTEGTSKEKKVPIKNKPKETVIPAKSKKVETLAVAAHGNPAEEKSQEKPVGSSKESSYPIDDDVEIGQNGWAVNLKQEEEGMFGGTGGRIFDDNGDVIL